MRYTIFLSLIILIACNSNEHKRTVTKADTLKTIGKEPPVTSETKPDTVAPKTYANKRFREVSVKGITEDSFLVEGQGQIFEANFGWVVEDGHEELLNGFQMTTAGAPEWGKFQFTITATKKRKNSTLTLILFELSSKDGSRQYELPIALY